MTDTMPLEPILKPTGELFPTSGTNTVPMVQNAPTGLTIDLNTLSDLKVEYLKCGDPSEYKFVRRNIPGGWVVWQALVVNGQAGPLIGEWRDELAAKLRSEALSRIIEAAEGEGKDSLGANKYIYEALSREDKKAGRPSRESIKQEAARLYDEDKIKEEAYDRLFAKED